MMYTPFFVICVVLLLAASLESSAEVTLGEPQDIVFTAGIDNTPQRYVLMLPGGFTADEPHDLLIALHGHGSDRWQFARDRRDECRAARDAAARHSMIFVSPDYRATTSWMGPKAEADIVQIIGDVRRQYKIGKIFLTGASMGGASTLTFSALHPELLDGACAMNGTANHLEYRNFQEAIAESFGGSKAKIPLEYKRRSAEYWPERFTMPLSLTTGGNDASVPPQSVLRLVDILKQLQRRALLIHRKDGGHSTNYADGTLALEFVVNTAHGRPCPLPADDGLTLSGQ